VYEEERCLMFFSDEKTATATKLNGKKRMSIGDETVVLRTASLEDPSRPHMFTIITSGSEPVYLCAETAASHATWCDALDAVIGGSNLETRGNLVLATPQKPKPWSSRWCVLDPVARTLSIYKKRAHVGYCQ
jgi:hypothetical protein